MKSGLPVGLKIYKEGELIGFLTAAEDRTGVVLE